MTSIPDGWRLVPCEPDEAVLRAVGFAIYRYADYCTARDAERAAPRAYTAMLSAAPSVGDDVVEKIARIIDPEAWSAADLMCGSGAVTMDFCQPSLAKARAALAVLTGE